MSIDLEMKIKSKLCKSEYIQISKLFSSACFNSFALQEDERIEYIAHTFKNFCLDTKDLTIESAYSEFYKILTKKYRNEYVFKNIIFKDLVLKKHKIKECVSIPEFNVGRSKADLAVFNGVSTVYEIKSEIDTTDRLLSQISDYSTFFEFVNVVTCEKHIKKVESLVDDTVGIIIIDDYNKVIIHKEASTNLSNITHKALFYSLRKKEYLNVICEIYGGVPIMPNTKIFEYCFNLFKEIEIEKAYKITISQLKNRQLNNEHIDLINKLPLSLKSMTLQHSYNKIKCENIIKNMEKIIF